MLGPVNISLTSSFAANFVFFSPLFSFEFLIKPMIGRGKFVPNMS